VLSERLVPQSLVEAVLPQQLPYRLSSGVPLLQDPRIHHALQLLKLLQQPLPLLELSALLRSPWLLRGAEMETRSQIDLRLRRLGLLELSLPRLLQLLAHGAAAAPRFLGALQALSQLEQRPSSCSRWAQRFTSALSFFEWAENGEQNSVAFNAYNGWREALDRFVALEEVVAPLSAAHALQELRQLLSEMELEGGRSGRPLEVMTPQQADGVQFDALWVLSCDDSRWPVQPPLSPFLPQQWQRQRLPGADPAEAQQQARALLQRLRSAAATVCFSCSEREQPGGEVVRGLTPLLGTLEWERPPARTAGLWWQPQSPLALEAIEEPSLELPQGVAVRGGSTLLANQSQCPFRAFVRHRLQAEALEQPQAGLAARERGTLLHLLLERCWRELEGDSARLQQLDEAQLRSLVNSSATGVVEQFRGRLQGRIGPRFAANESERLGELTLRALQLDRQRETPFRVEEMESQQQIELAGLTLSIKMDRVDRLQDGGRVLIDYKSGKVSRSQWQGERPAAPQLPLYALLLEQVVAVLYSQIRAQEVLYRGEQQSEAVMAGAAGAAAVVVAEGWTQQLQQWREVLERLAQEFRRGEVGVTPLQGRSSCQYCGLEPLCRVEW
jgi:ATP-dependent helicase/nuclease subunit B